MTRNIFKFVEVLPDHSLFYCSLVARYLLSCYRSAIVVRGGVYQFDFLLLININTPLHFISDALFTYQIFRCMSLDHTFFGLFIVGTRLLS